MRSEIDWQNEAIVMQPCKVRYVSDDGGRPALHTPDAFVYARTGAHLFVELKYEDEARLSEAKWQAIGTAFAKAGFRYHVVTDRILDGNASDNVREVWRDRLTVLPDDVRLAELADTYGIGDGATISQIVEKFPWLSRPQVNALIRQGVFAIDDIETPLDLCTLRYRGGSVRRLAADFRTRGMR